MVLSNRNLLFQGSIFRAMLVSGRVVLNSPELAYRCISFLASMTSISVPWPKLHLDKCKEWHVPSLFPQTLPQPKKHQHRFRFYHPTPKPTPNLNLCFFSFCALKTPSKKTSFCFRTKDQWLYQPWARSLRCSNALGKTVKLAVKAFVL